MRNITFSGMRKSSTVSTVLSAVVSVGVFAFPFPVQAGGGNGWVPYTDPIYPPGGFLYSDGDDTPEARAFVGHPGDCVTVDIDGPSETQFTVSIDAKDKFTPVGGIEKNILKLGDLIECYGENFGTEYMVMSEPNYLDWEPLAFFGWMDLLGGEEFLYECLAVTASNGGNPQVDSVVGFPTDLMGTSIESLDDVQAAADPGVSWGSGTFYNSPFFISIMLFDDSDREDQNLSWDFNFTVTPCGEGSLSGHGPDLDHYRRRAEQAEASALPDTL